MKKTINESEFIDGFTKIGREDNFTREARRELYNWYTYLEDGLDEEIEYDPIAICCDWTEWESEEELIEEWGVESIEELEQDTTVIKLENGNILMMNY